MEKAIEIKATGIKCDSCDWKDMTAAVDGNWLNKPCPKCGANLLTEADLASIEFLFAFAELINGVNSLLPPRSDDTSRVTASIKMNGTGNMEFEIEPEYS